MIDRYVVSDIVMSDQINMNKYIINYQFSS